MLTHAVGRRGRLRAARPRRPLADDEPVAARPASTRSSRSGAISGGGSPASSAATTRPRAQRSVSSKRAAPGARRGHGRRARAAQSAPPDRRRSARRGRQTVAPSSIIAWFKAAARPAGTSRRPLGERARPCARAVEALEHAPHVRVDGGGCALNANDATAAAVYGPTPGSSLRSSGQPCSATCARRAWSASARRL